MIQSTSGNPHWNETEIRATIPDAIARYTVNRAHTILADIDADELTREIIKALGSRGNIPDLMTVYEWRLAQIRKYYDAWLNGDLPAQQVLERINYTLSVWLPPKTTA